MSFKSMTVVEAELIRLDDGDYGLGFHMPEYAETSRPSLLSVDIRQGYDGVFVIVVPKYVVSIVDYQYVLAEARIYIEMVLVASGDVSTDSVTPELLAYIQRHSAYDSDLMGDFMRKVRNTIKQVCTRCGNVKPECVCQDA
jgi:hypothetical protein